jgi:hypothetical protein
MCAIDLLLIAYRAYAQIDERVQWMNSIKRDKSVRWGSSVYNKIKASVSARLPLFIFWDYFDIVLRLVMVLFVFLHYNHYYSPDLDSGLGKFEENMNNILKVI